jgi:hypothetical protein
MTDTNQYDGDLDHRHPSTRAIARWFTYDHLPDGMPRQASKACCDLAEDAIRSLPDGPELTAGLRKLLEAKDCFVRSAIARQEARTSD